MRRLGMWLVVMVMWVGIPLATWAADTKTDAAQEEAAVALAGARARAELAMRDARPVMDENRSGWNAALQRTELVHNQIIRALERRMQVEERKDEGNRDTDVMDAVREKIDQANDTWEIYTAQARTDTTASYREAADTLDRLSQALEGLGNTERAWKEANLDAAMLRTLFDALTQRIGAARQQAEKAIGELQAKQKALEAELAAVNKFVAASTK